MEITAKVFKRSSGKSKGKWIVRLTYFDEVKGKTCHMERHESKRSDAIDTRDRLVNELKASHGQSQTGERIQFAQLSEMCKKIFYKEAVIVGGSKIAGVKSLATVLGQIKALNEFFGKRQIRTITTESLQDYKLWRLRAGSRRRRAVEGDKPASISMTTINREMSVMRKMMRFAFGKGWILKDIFFNAKVIDVSAELERDRVLTEREEKRLLEACQGERERTYTRTRSGKKETITARVGVNNPHLKTIILLALDAGMRRGEILKLRWQDIDFGAGLIRIVASHTKTERERLVPLTDRVKAELYRVREFAPGDKPFPFADFKRSWTTAKRMAEIDDLHFHDLRRTAITRWIMQGNPIAMAGKIAGHTQLQTTMKHYTSANADIVRGFTEKMNALNLQVMPANGESEFVN